MSSRPPVLFVSHEGTRTGAPMALLHLVRWLRDEGSIDPQVAILRDGPLTEAFAEVGRTTVLGTEVDWPSPTSAESALAADGRHAEVVRRQVARMRSAVAPIASSGAVYLNSVASVRLLHHLPGASPVIAHVHELRSAMRWSLGPMDAELVRNRVDHFITAADCVTDNLVREHGIAPDAVTRVYEFIDTNAVLAPPLRARHEIRAELGIEPDALVVGGSGWADWRKGIDLFIQLARAIDRDDVHLVWVGGLPGGSEGEQIEFDVAHSGAANRIHLVGLQSRPHDWYRAFDVFALTSREDPYPLVGLETALLGVPMVCFDGAGGMVELVRRGAEDAEAPIGAAVPFLDVEAMAAAAVALLDDPDLRAQTGERAGRFVQREHEVRVAAPSILEVIQRVLAASPRS